MKKYLLLPLFFIATNSSAERLFIFDDIKNAVLDGKAIRIVVDFTKCRSTNPSESKRPLYIGTFSPNEMLVEEKNIISSFTHFTMKQPDFNNLPVYEYVRYTIQDNTYLDLSYQILDARDYSVKGSGHYDCPLNVAVKVYD